MKKLQPYLTATLAILIVGLSFHTGFIQISYSLNKAYIAQNLCVNKDKPELNCNGKCYLKKQLNKAQDQAPIQDQIVNKLSINWTSTETRVWDAQEPHLNVLSKTFYFSNELQDGYLKAIDHPPSLV